MTEKTFKLIIYMCISQFLFIFIFIQFACTPRTQLHVTIVGMSAVLGLLVGGAAYSTYQSLKEDRERRENYKKLEETLKKMNKPESIPNDGKETHPHP